MHPFRDGGRRRTGRDRLAEGGEPAIDVRRETFGLASRVVDQQRRLVELDRPRERAVVRERLAVFRRDAGEQREQPPSVRRLVGARRRDDEGEDRRDHARAQWSSTRGHSGSGASPRPVRKSATARQPPRQLRRYGHDRHGSSAVLT